MIKQITHDIAEKMIASSSVIIIDIRDFDSYQQGHIEGAISLSIPNLQTFCNITEKEKSLLIYCYHGITSQAVAQHLVDQGFTEVYSLLGGFETWKAFHSISNNDK